MIMFCMKCGKKLDDNASFCDECGSVITPPTPNVNQYNAPTPNANQHGKPPKKPSGKALLIICICVLVAIIAVLSAVLIVKFGKGKDDAESAEKTKKTEAADSEESTENAEKQAELDELIDKYKTFLDDRQDIAMGISGYALVCLDEDDLPECFLMSEEATRAGGCGIARGLLYYNKVSDTCEYYDYSIVGSTYGGAVAGSVTNLGMSVIEYAEKGNRFRAFGCDLGGPSNTMFIYQFGSDGAIELLGLSDYEMRSDNTATYSIGNGSDWSTAVWRDDLSKSDYEEFVNSFGEMKSTLTFKNSSLTLDMAYKKFSKKR